MKWRRGYRSAQVEDRRGGRGKAVATVAGGGGLLVLVITLLLGGDLSSVLGGGGGGGGVALTPQAGGGAQAGGAQIADQDRELVSFVSFVLDDIQGTWAKIFAKRGQAYRQAKLVLFSDEIASACGRSSAATGPFYCPGDEKAYIDLSFYRLLKRRFGAPGDFAQAYVLAHEIGHHVQNVLGTSTAVHRAQQRDPASANALSVRQELQADCFAGIWAHSTAKRDLLERGDIEEGLRAASAIGDDTLQRQAGRRVSPESWTHGSSAQRVRWFKRGFESGDIDRCDTFSVKRL